MATSIIHPETPLRPEALDAFLRAGYRPAGQSIYSCDYLRTDEDDAIYGCIQLRIPLAGYTFRRQHRRLLRRNAQRFRAEIGPAALPDAATHRVNAKYLERFPDRSRRDLEYHLRAEWDGAPKLDTHSVRVYEADRLVAFSYFDVGKTTVYTKTGIYDPAYARDSLGTYTLLLELEWAVARGTAHYHPGYYAPGYPAFNYKLEFGPTEYRDCRTGAWHRFPPGNEPSTPVDPYRHNEAALREAAEVLRAGGLRTTLKEYPSFTARFHFPGSGRALLDAPFVLQLSRVLTGGISALIAYDNASGAYSCFQPANAGLRDLKAMAIGPGGYPRYPKPVFADDVIVTASSPATLLAGLRRRNLAG